MEDFSVQSINTLITDIVQQSKNLEFVSISDSVLSADLQKDLKFRVRRGVHDYRIRNTDWRMYDTLKSMPGIDLNSLRVVHDVIVNHPDVTKRFYDSSRTFGSLIHYGELSTKNFSWSRNFGIASTILRDAFRPIHLDPIKFSSDMDIDEVFSDKSTSSGAIGSGSKDKNWEQIKHYANVILNDIKANVPFSKIWIPAMPFHRSQLHDLSTGLGFNPNYKEKDRLIWGVDASTVLIEALFARPLINYSKDAWFGYAGGKAPDVLRSNIHHAMAAQDYWYSTDYSKFDQTIPNWLIHECFSFVRECYDPKYKKIIDWIEYNFTNTKLALPDGRVLEVHKGIPSGSHFTQLIGSMANALMMLTYLASIEDHRYTDDQIKHNVEYKLSTDAPFPKQRMFVMGDDNLFFYKDKLDIKDISNYVHTVFGVIINTDKTVVGHHNTPKFLSRYWRAVDGEDRNQIDLLLNLVLPERVRSYDGYSPIDILFSLYYTFRYAFHAPYRNMNAWFSDSYRQSGRAITDLARLPKNELPGSAKVFSRDALRSMQHYADLLRSGSVA